MVLIGRDLGVLYGECGHAHSAALSFAWTVAPARQSSVDRIPKRNQYGYTDRIVVDFTNRHTGGTQIDAEQTLAPAVPPGGGGMGGMGGMDF
jgi:hypothetical protein